MSYGCFLEQKRMHFSSKVEFDIHYDGLRVKKGSGAVARNRARTCSLARSHSAVKSQPRKLLTRIGVDHDTPANMGVPMNRFEASNRVHKLWLAIECGTLFLGVPAAQAAGWLQVPVIPLLLLMAGGCWLALCWHHHIAMRDLRRPKVPGSEWRRIFATYAASVSCMLLLLWAIKPAAMFSLMRLLL